MMKKEFITIGKVINTQGNKGAVRVLPLTDFPERFSDMESILVKTGVVRNEYIVEQVYFHKKFVIIKFLEVNSITEANGLKESLLQVTREQLVRLPADSYYVFDLLELDVYTMGNEYLGKITDVLKTGANDVLVVQDDKGSPVLIPALKKVVKELNFDEGLLKVDLPDGLL